MKSSKRPNMRDPSSLMFLRNFDIYYPLGRTNRHDPLSDGGKLMAPMKFPGFSFSYELGKRLSPTEQSEESCHPLFIYSHDEGGSSVENNALLWSLASRGFIVAAPYHGPFPQSLHDRPREVVNVLNYFLSDQMGSPFTICKDGDGKTQVAVGGHGLGAFTALAVANGHTMPAKLREDFPVLVNAPDFAADTRFKVVVASSPRTLDFNGYALFNSEQGSSGKTTIPDLEGKGVKTLVLGALLDTTSSIANNVDPITNTIQCEVEPDPVNGRPKQKSGRTKQTFRADYKFAGAYVLLGPAAFFWAWLNLSVRFSFVSPVSPGHSGFIDHCPLHEQLENHIVQEGYRIFNYAHLPGLEKLDATSVCLGLLSRDPDDVIGAGHKEGATQLFIPLCNEYWTSLRTAAEAGCLGHKHDAVCGIFEGIAANEQLRLLRDDPICSLATGHPLTGDRGAVIDYTQYACSIRSKLSPISTAFSASPVPSAILVHYIFRSERQSLISTRQYMVMTSALIGPLWMIRLFSSIKALMREIFF